MSPDLPALKDGRTHKKGAGQYEEAEHRFITFISPHVDQKALSGLATHPPVS
jgi:hypothetical protein